MFLDTLLTLAVLGSLVPAALLPWRREARPDGPFWAALLLATLAPATMMAAWQWQGWSATLTAALWMTITVSMASFMIVAAVSRTAWRLSVLLVPYLLLLAIVASLLAPGQEPVDTALVHLGGPWVLVHIIVSVVTTALATLAAVAGLAVFLQERALKRKRRGSLTPVLPSLADGEKLEFRLLAAAETVLGLGILSGMVLELHRSGRPLVLDHKTLLSMLAFIVIAGLLWAHATTGVRGRKAARIVLLAYLLLTLGTAGVKFVTQVLL